MRLSIFRVRKCCRSISFHSRCYSTEQRPQARTIDVPVGGSGDIQLEILPAIRPHSTTSHILIYLPSGLAISRNAKNETSNGARVPSLLSSLLPNSTIITLNYRLSPPSRIFPFPIHDTAIAFNHMLQTFTTNATFPKISLLGSHIGGTLSTTLALTSPNSLHSVAASSPILDWVSLDTESDISAPDIPAPTLTINHRNKPKSKTNPYTSHDTQSLLNLRSTLFLKPDNYFDPFASPTLFLRAPGRDCPDPQMNHDDDHNPSFSSSPEEETAPPPIIRRRKVLRRWPPYSPPESVRLPYFRIFVGDEQEGEELVLRRQGEEMVDLMRRVCFYGRDREVGEARVGLDVLKTGKATEEKAGLLGVEEGARWLAKMIEEDR